MRDFIVVTCEHGGNHIPAEYAGMFHGWRRVLQSHRGFDAGALAMAREMAAVLRAPLTASTVSRLLVDINRSVSNPRVWSSVTRSLTPIEKKHLVQRHYAPYRRKVSTIVDEAVKSGYRVVHLSSHSFTPVLNGHVRTADVGLLYDPARAGETALAESWKGAFTELAPRLCVRRNYPYSGKGDGLTRTLRRCYPPARYVGIEIELNQSFPLGGGKPWRDLRASVVATFQAALHGR